MGDTFVLSQCVYCDIALPQLSCPNRLPYPEALMAVSECGDIKGCVRVDWDVCMMCQDAEGVS